LVRPRPLGLPGTRGGRRSPTARFSPLNRAARRKRGSAARRPGLLRPAMRPGVSWGGSRGFYDLAGSAGSGGDGKPGICGRPAFFPAARDLPCSEGGNRSLSPAARIQVVTVRCPRARTAPRNRRGKPGVAERRSKTAASPVETTGMGRGLDARMSWLAPSGAIGWRGNRHRPGRVGPSSTPCRRAAPVKLATCRNSAHLRRSAHLVGPCRGGRGLRPGYAPDEASRTTALDPARGHRHREARRR